VTTIAAKADAASILGAAAVLDKKREQQYREELKARDKQIEILSDRLDAMKSSRWSIPLSRRKNSKSGRPYIRVIVPDSHGCYIDSIPLSAMLQDFEALDIREVVLLGDHLDCSGFLAKHHRQNYIKQAKYTFEQDIDGCNDFLDKVQARCPRATFHYLEGNHERRLETWCIDQSLKEIADAEWLLKQVGAKSVLNIEKRGLNYYKQGQKYMGLELPCTIKLGHCYFTHGEYCGVGAARRTLQKFGGNVVFGHTHTASEASLKTVDQGVMKAWCVGCLCELQPMYLHGQVSDWSHGYGVQIAQDDGSFLQLTIPLIDGKSYLIGMGKQFT